MTFILSTVIIIISECGGGHRTEHYELILKSNSVEKSDNSNVLFLDFLFQWHLLCSLNLSIWLEIPLFEKKYRFDQDLDVVSFFKTFQEMNEILRTSKM